MELVIVLTAVEAITTRRGVNLKRFTVVYVNGCEGVLRRVLVATTAGALGAGALLTLTASAQAPLSLSVRVIEHPPGGGLPRHLFSGRLANGAEGELVTVLAKGCPRDSETAVAGATTVAGGFWEAEAATASQRTAMTYRARWEGRFSEPVKVWTPIFVNAAKAGPRSVIVFVETSGALQNLNRKFVQLQRFDRSTGRWRLYKRASLRRNTGPGLFPFSFTTTFRQVRRGLTVRVLVPRKTAAPCYQARATDSIKM